MAEYVRNLNIEMDWLDDASFEIVGILNDNVHSLKARFEVSFPDYVIRAATSEITRMPYDGICTGSTTAIRHLEGEKIGRGFRRRVGEVLGGAASCNHLHTLVNVMGATAFQMNYMAAKRLRNAEERLRAIADDPAKRRLMVLSWMPQLRNTCYTFSEANDHLFEPPRDE